MSDPSTPFSQSRRPLRRACGYLAGFLALSLGAAACGHATHPAALHGSTTSALPSATATTSASSPPVTGASVPTTTAPAPISLRVVVVGPLLPQPISREVAVALGDHLEILGGRTAAKTSTDEVVRWTPGSTSTVEGHLARRVHDASGVVLGSQAFVFGGGDLGSVADVQSVNGGTGARVGAMPTGRSDLSAVAMGGTAYMIGGFDDVNGVLDVLATTDGRTFRTVAHLSGTVRYGAAVAVGSKALVFGGESGGRSSDAVLELDPAHGTIAQVATLPVRLSHATAFVLGGQTYVAGGETDGARVSAIYRYDPATRSFSVAGQLPDTRSDASAAVLGNTAYVVGGETPGTVASVIAITVQ